MLWGIYPYSRCTPTHQYCGGLQEAGTNVVGVVRYAYSRMAWVEKEEGKKERRMQAVESHSTPKLIKEKEALGYQVP